MDRQLDRLLTYSEVAAALGVSESSLRRRVRMGSFPAPVRLGGNVRFRSSTVQEYIQSLEGPIDEKPEREAVEDDPDGYL